MGLIILSACQFYPYVLSDPQFYLPLPSHPCRWSTCSRTCGVGVRSSTRHCNSPPPSHGGQYCTGERVRYESCIMRQCQPDAVDFRTQQCQAYNGKTFGLSDIPEDVIWVPKYSGSE